MSPFQRSSLVALLVGSVLFSYPVLNVPNVSTLVLGVPLLYAYLFSAWLALIGLACLLSRSRD